MSEYSTTIKLYSKDDLGTTCLTITRESFIAAYVDAMPYERCSTAAREWAELHLRHVYGDEIDEDPP